jgi:hypothetical protein
MSEMMEDMKMFTSMILHGCHFSYGNRAYLISFSSREPLHEESDNY